MSKNVRVIEVRLGLTVLLSYGVPIAAKEWDTIGEHYYRTEEFYSVTTSKHINKWLGDHRDCERVPQQWLDNVVEGAL